MRVILRAHRHGFERRLVTLQPVNSRYVVNWMDLGRRDQRPRVRRQIARQ